MLPVVVIGADDSVRAVLEPWKRDGLIVLEFDDLEAAVYGLADLLARTADDEIPKVAQNADGRWECNVMYGTYSLGKIVTAQRGQLEHTGWTIVAVPDIGNNQGAPRRVQDQQVDLPGSTVALEAMAKVRAHILLDSTGADSARNVQAIRRVLESTPTP